MKNFYHRNQAVLTLLILVPMLLFTTTNLAQELVVIVPWTEDTTYHECTSDIPPLIDPTASSSCGGVAFTRSIQTWFGACINERTIKRTWHYTDACANDTTVIQTIIVNDTIPPVVTVPWAADTTYHDCLDDVPPIIYPTVTDNCALKDTTRSIQTWFGACNNDRRIKRTWIFRDECNNEGRAVQVIIVSDTIAPVVTVPWAADTTYHDCLDDVPPIIYPTVTDNCALKDTTRSIQTWFGACNNDRRIKRTWIFRDECNNEGRAVQVIIVSDTIAPVVTVPWAADTTYHDCLDDVPPIIYPTVTDNCALKDTTRSIQTWFGDCINERTIKRTWIFRDECNNEGRAVQVIIVKDTIPPEVVVPWAADTTYVDCADDVPPILWPTVTDNCALKDTTRSIQTWFGDCINERTIKRTWIFRDECDNEGRAVQVIIVSDTIPPSFTVPPDMIIYKDADCNYNADLTITGDVTDEADNCSSGLDATYSDIITNGSCEGEHIILRTWSVSDECGNVADQVQTITVTDNTPPAAICKNIIVELDVDGYASIIADDINNGSYDNCGIASLEIDINSFTCADVGYNAVILTVTDFCNNLSTCDAMILVEDNIAPDAICKDIVVELDANGFAEIVPADIDNGSSDACGIASLTIDQSTFSCEDVGTKPVTLTVTDANDNVSYCTSIVTIEDNIGPDAICQTTVLHLDETGSAILDPEVIGSESFDACGIATLTVMPNTFNCSDYGLNNVTLTVTDNNGNISTCSRNIFVADTVAPMAICQDLTIQLDANGYASIDASDIDNGTTDACGIELLILDPFEFTCNEIGENNVILTATDIHGNTSSCTAIVTVEDIINPVAVCQDITVQLDEYGYATIEPTDIDGGSYDECGISTYMIDISNFDLSNIGENIVTLTVEDSSDNWDECTAIVTVEDNIPPVAICQDVLVSLDDSGYGSITAEDVDGGSYDASGIASITIDISEFDCDDIGENQVTLTVEDNNGNISTCVSIVSVSDRVSPVAIAQNITVELNESGYTYISADLINNGSYDNCGIDHMEVGPETFDCLDLVNSPIYAILSVYDASGNISSAASEVTVVDNIFPTFTCPDDIFIELSEGQDSYSVQGDEFDVTDLWDNCYIDVVTNDFNNQETLNGAELPEGTTEITWTVIDQSGNTTECTFSVTVTIITSISMQQLNNVNIYPNPVSTSFIIDLGTKYEKVSLVLMDFNGKVMVRNEYKSIEVIDMNVQTFENGVYLIKLISDKQSGIYRIVKQ